MQRAGLWLCVHCVLLVVGVVHQIKQHYALAVVTSDVHGYIYHSGSSIFPLLLSAEFTTVEFCSICVLFGGFLREKLPFRTWGLSIFGGTVRQNIPESGRAVARSVGSNYVSCFSALFSVIVLHRNIFCCFCSRALLDVHNVWCCCVCCSYIDFVCRFCMLLLSKWSFGILLLCSSCICVACLMQY